MTETKTFTASTKLSDNGTVEAIVATLSATQPDLDGDTYAAGAIESGEVVLSAWNHSATLTGGASPVGKGVLRAEAGKLKFSGEFFDTVAGQEARRTVKALGDLAQWSYGFRVIDSAPNKFGGRLLRRIRPFEASPVAQGAGLGTRTTSAKDEAQREHLRSIAIAHGMTPASHRDELASEYARFIAVSQGLAAGVR